MHYFIKPAKKYQSSRHARNKLCRRLFKGNLPPDHKNWDGVEVDANDLDAAMNDIYKPRFSKGEPEAFRRGKS